MSYKEDLNIIRDLAAEVAELSNLPRYEQARHKWIEHNDLQGGTEPLIWVCPDDDGGWLELVPCSSLKSEDEDLRVLEHRLRKLIYQHMYFNDDYVQEPILRYDMPGEYTGYTYADASQKSAWGIPIHAKGISSGAYHLDNYLDKEENVEKLLHHEVDFIPDDAEYRRLYTKYSEAVDGLIEIQFIIPYVTLVQSLLIELVHLRGLAELMMDLYDNPEWLHKILDHMSASKARLLERLEQKNMLYDNRSNLYTGSGGLGYTSHQKGNHHKGDGSAKLSDMWGFADAQEFSDVSPAMFSEFAIAYQKRGLNKFGLISYGCCEPLNNKFDMIFSSLPNIRRLSVSPWSDVNIAAENIKNKAIFSWKPNPSLICCGIDEQTVSKMLAETANATRNCVTEIILKDVRTCAGTPEYMQKFIEMSRNAFK